MYIADIVFKSNVDQSDESDKKFNTDSYQLKLYNLLLKQF